MQLDVDDISVQCCGAGEPEGRVRGMSSRSSVSTGGCAHRGPTAERFRWRAGVESNERRSRKVSGANEADRDQTVIVVLEWCVLCREVWSRARQGAPIKISLQRDLCFRRCVAASLHTRLRGSDGVAWG